MNKWKMLFFVVGNGDVGREDRREKKRAETGARRRRRRRRRRKRGKNKQGKDVASSSSYRVFGGPTSLDAGGQGGTDGPKRGFLFGVGLCSTTFPILK